MSMRSPCPSCGSAPWLAHAPDCAVMLKRKAEADAAHGDLCEGCPPWGFLSNTTRCEPCPRRDPAQAPFMVETRQTLGPKIKGEISAPAPPADHSKLLDRLARAALDASSYADHDSDCTNHRDGSCSCGYNETQARVLRLAQQVADMQVKP